MKLNSSEIHAIDARVAQLSYDIALLEECVTLEDYARAIKQLKQMSKELSLSYIGKVIGAQGGGK